MSSFCICKATHIFFSKSTCELDIVLTRTVNILTTYELVKLRMLWTTGPWLLYFLTQELTLKTEYICSVLSCSWKLNALGRLSDIVYNADNFCDFQFTSCIQRLIWKKKGSTIKGKHLLPKPFLRREANSILTASWNWIHSTKNKNIPG